MSAYNQALEALQRGDMAAADAKAKAGLRAKPRDLPLLRLRGYILQTTDRFAEAADCYAKVVARAPDDWEIWNNLGNARQAAGDGAGALIALRRAAAMRPDLVPIQANLAAALASAGQLEEALAAYRNALALTPGDDSLALEAARLARHLGRPEEALPLLASDAHDPQILLERGRILAALHRLDEAESAHRAALRGQPSVPEIWLELGIIIERAGRPDKLPALLAEAAARNVPTEALAYLQALRLQHEGRRADALAWALRAPPELEPARVQRLIARLADREGRPDLAFVAAERANAIAAAEHPDARESAAAYREHVAALGDQVTEDWYASWLPPPLCLERVAPVFLVGFPRSGTTLLDTLLMGHPAVHLLEEIPLLDSVMAEVRDPARLGILNAAETARLRALYFERLDAAAPPPPGTTVIDKLPLNILGAPLIHRIFPDARFIFASRHPCDVVLSCFMQGFELNAAMANFLDIGDTARLYDLVLTSWARSRAVLPLEVFALRYEQLVTAPEAAVRPLVEFLGLDWTDEILDHQRTAAARGTISTPSYNQVTQRLYRDASGRWERYREPLAPVLPILLPWAKRLGYEDSPNSSRMPA